jgi:hypothetical protein
MNDEPDPIMQALIFLIGAVCILCTITYTSSIIGCHSKWDDSKFGVFTGCMVNSNGKYVPEDSVRVIKWVNE